ncbi:MAG TPA: ABC transporter ATP-binding protein [Candidatus Cloacimonetes bacterium]|nr:ABC transporter ATP-binding protein [Candidatus Cloacimonadota bacterium]HEX37807.1 ABC transporter ATP-binding protein [Candidatus Cloacimonadota bacterium]
MNDDYLLKTSHLFCKFPSQKEWLLKDVSIDTKVGEIILIKGVNGSGKTTLLSLLCGIIPKEIKAEVRGKIHINDVEISDLTLAQSSPFISMTFQEPDYQLSFPKVIYELAFGPENLKISRHEIEDRIKYVTELLKIDHLLYNDIATLSYGQKKLVCIASIMTLSPKILLLDEPDDGLSFASVEQVKKCILAYRNEKLFIIATTKSYFDDIADRKITLS